MIKLGKEPEPRPNKVGRNTIRGFFLDAEKLKPGDYISYTNELLYKDVERIAADYGVTVDYCNPHTEGYNLHGPQTVIVIAVNARG